MSAQNDGGPAFPSGKSENPGFENSHPLHEGMTLLDWFAGQALAGICASGPGTQWTNERLAADAYGLAEAMIAERQRRAGK